MPSRTTAAREPKAPRIPSSLTPADPLEHELRDDGTYIALDWGSVDLVGHDVESVDFERCRFTDTRLSAGTLRRAGFADVAFGGCDPWDIAGVGSLDGAILAPADARSALPSLAAALGITIAG